ncbi:peptidylglycine alpha-hydroxylating monooxygenase-like [Adelges cooleyi]|uniref:peptidylglycine alpha-hydroxylating monooxygenase-like n=1 Tax=Adelges cooleyi TaxID=133065 RepID=UPI00217FD83A|nr:peptidylglycine alpha-hydroxylating monooxygenase-like [Adelges cooleyi]
MNFRNIIVVAFALFAVLWSTEAASPATARIHRHSLLIPNVVIQEMDVKFCTAIKLNPGKSYEITKLETTVSSNVTHHMFMYGCPEPASNDRVWNCGGTLSTARKEVFTKAKPCKANPTPYHYWARDGSTLKFPHGVGSMVGGNSTANYLVLQTHYLRQEEYDVLDSSGVHVFYKNN